MHWTRILIAVLISGIATSMTDWFFAGDWIHKRFTYPEVWRQGSETRAIVVSSVFPFVACAAFLLLTLWLGNRSLAEDLELAVLVWILAPLPLILTNAAFIRLHRVFVVLYSVGWLVKLGIAALVASWLLP